MPLSKRLKKEWVCPEGCKSSKTPCKHLEKLLPAKDGGVDRHYIQYRASVEQEPSQDSTESDTVSLGALINKLKSFGLSQYQVSILIERDINKKTFAELVDEYHWVDTRTAARFYRDTVEQLRRIYEKRGHKYNA